MNNRLIIALIFCCTFAIPIGVTCKEKKEAGPLEPTGWLYLHNESREFTVADQDAPKSKRQIPRGSVIPIFKTRENHGSIYGRAAALNFSTGMAEMGWVQVELSEIKPVASYPSDDDLIAQLGTPYLDDAVVKHTDIGRYLVHQAHGPDLLLCYIITGQLSMAKLVVFVPSGGKYTAGASLNIPMTEIASGITSLEIRDLVGDGNDCIITKENFRSMLDTAGTNLLIRRVADGQFKTVWQAPIKFKNLSQYSGKLNILQPPEANIGQPGTVTTGDVTYQPSGSGQVPNWKGHVEFFAVNREKPLDTVAIERSCPWNGSEFAPLH